ncbi:hypothetical protein NARC_40198 [Candidatus Nitrosocosmicus arcticus]|uniref:Uncharacterized protein n=1 Tax=Candidatus Nitrosocosmicus arcticus TaxID=2035267 RepID=A0A557SXA6_9ARCH|nr:hypothetical protein NARC_40198 [Candidatus Nitrosocosmicus arcticus]
MDGSLGNYVSHFSPRLRLELIYTKYLVFKSMSIESSKT